jgi:hypothetical protein
MNFIVFFFFLNGMSLKWTLITIIYQDGLQPLGDYINFIYIEKIMQTHNQWHHTKLIEGD